MHGMVIKKKINIEFNNLFGRWKYFSFLYEFMSFLLVDIWCHLRLECFNLGINYCNRFRLIDCLLRNMDVDFVSCVLGGGAAYSIELDLWFCSEVP